MPPFAILWLWCLGAPESTITYDLCFRFNDGFDLLTVAEFDVAWLLAGGTVGDPRYNQYIGVFSLELCDTESDPPCDPPVYKMLSAWWTPVTTTFFSTPIEERVCSLPDYE